MHAAGFALERIKPERGPERINDSSRGKRKLSVQSGGNQVFAQLLDGREKKGLHSQGNGCMNVDLFVVEEQRFVRTGAQALKDVEIDFRIGLGHAKLVAPYKDIEAMDPVVGARDALEN